jgi:hypothetical protein
MSKCKARLRCSDGTSPLHLRSSWNSSNSRKPHKQSGSIELDLGPIDASKLVCFQCKIAFNQSPSTNQKVNSQSDELHIASSPMSHADCSSHSQALAQSRLLFLLCSTRLINTRTRKRPKSRPRQLFSIESRLIPCALFVTPFPQS